MRKVDNKQTQHTPPSLPPCLYSIGTPSNVVNKCFLFVLRWLYQKGIGSPKKSSALLYSSVAVLCDEFVLRQFALVGFYSY